MNTAARADALATAARQFSLLGEVSASALCECIRLELGHAETLDGFRPYAGCFTTAVARQPLLHIISGNTPHAGLQSLLRGLLLGVPNLVKLPGEGLPEVEQFAALLPPALRDLVTIRRDLPEDWLRQAPAWIVFGSDETIAHFRRKAGPATIFEAHPHRVSLGLVFDDPDGRSIVPAARDASRFNQKGCLSPHDFYVAGDAREYARRLAEAMARYEESDPRGAITVHEAAQIADVRANYRFRAANDRRVGLWESGSGSSAWTVIYEEDPWFAPSCLNRVVFVKPLPHDLAAAVGPAREWMAAVGIWPATEQNAVAASVLRPSRICPVGRMQEPPLAWHQEGRQILAPLVRWVDFETDLL